MLGRLWRQLAHHSVPVDLLLYSRSQVEERSGWRGHLVEDPPLIHNLMALLERIAAAGADAEAFCCLEAFTIFAVQFRYDADPEPMGRHLTLWA